MSKKILLGLGILGLIALSVGLVVMMASPAGESFNVTVGSMIEGKSTSASNVNQLESGKAYVWHHEGADIRDDLTGEVGQDVFFSCIMGDYNFKKKELEETVSYPKIIWLGPEDDAKVPTLTGNDRLIYVSSTQVPETIVFERYEDYGYTIGVANMVSDLGGHYYLTFADLKEDEFKYFIDLNSDAGELSNLTAITRLYLDKVGGKRVDESNVSEGGTVTGLKKDAVYTCEFYTGTFYQDFNLAANIHTLGMPERMETNDYEFMHSNFIVLEIPKDFKSGYYLVNGVGVFKYVNEKEVGDGGN